MSIKERLIEVLQERGISIQEFCKQAKVGKNAVYQLSEYDPSLKNILKMADCLQISLDYLAGFSDYEKIKVKDYKINFYDNTIKYMNTFGVTKQKFYKDLGISTDAFTRWKRGAVPYFSTVVQVAKYLNVSIDELLGRL